MTAATCGGTSSNLQATCEKVEKYLIFFFLIIAKVAVKKMLFSGFKN